MAYDKPNRESDLDGIKVTRYLAAALLLLAPLLSNATGLGRLTVLSAIGEPFHARVELISDGELDPASLTVQLASPETYQRFNVPYTRGRVGLRLTVERGENGRAYINIVSGQFEREPVLPLLIDLQWSSGRVVRSYAALLDLPSLDASAPPAARARAPEPVARPAVPPAPAAAPAPVARPAPAAAAPRAAAPPPPKAAPPAAKPAEAAPDLEKRARALEAEAAVEEKKLASARDRVAQLEKTLTELQRQVTSAPEAPAAKSAAPAAAAPAMEAKEKPQKPAAPAAPASEPKPAPAVEAKGAPEAAKPAAAAAPTPGPKPAPAMEAKSAPEAAKPAEPVAAAPAPKPKPAPSPVAPPPPAEPGIADMAMENLPLLGGAAVLLLVGGLLVARRRRAAAEQASPAMEPDAAAMAEEPAPAAAGDAEQVDAIEEADVFMAHGREAQAAQVLEDAVAQNPARGDVWLKLFEVHAARNDTEAFARSARKFRDLTGGQGENWIKAAALGFAIDPENPLYAEAGGAEPQAARSAPETPEMPELEFGEQAAAAEAAEPEPVAEPEPEPAPEPKTKPRAEEHAPLDFEIAVPPAGETTTDISFDESEAGAAVPDLPLDSGETGAAPEEPAALDFKIELPKSDEAAEPPAEEPPRDAGSEAFKSDLEGISLDLGETPAAESESAETAPADAAPSGEKDPLWQEIQEKFELVKAYRLLGAESESIAGLLQEIIKEGDAGQRAEARKLLEELEKEKKE